VYQSEADFSSALLTALRAKAKRMLIQRIESGETARGIPDLYLRNKKREYWVELKNIKRFSVYASQWQIPWRPGQTTWAATYYRFSGQSSYTIAALKDGYLIIPMTPYQQYKNHIVHTAQCVRMTQLSDVITCIIEGLDQYVC
jgi:hypothetical protein